MTINDMLEQGITFQGERRVTANVCGDECVFYKGDSEWGYAALDEPWGDYEVSYMYPMCGWLEIELEIPGI